jgi:hypothetical protein
MSMLMPLCCVSFLCLLLPRRQVEALVQELCSDAGMLTRLCVVSCRVCCFLIGMSRHCCRSCDPVMSYSRCGAVSCLFGNMCRQVEAVI